MKVEGKVNPHREAKVSHSERERLWILGALVAVLLLSATLVWHDLGAREVLGQDENATIAKLDQPSLGAVLAVTYMKITGQPGNMQPLYFLVQHLFWPLVGFSAFMLRFLPSMFAILAVAMTYKLGEALFGRTAGRTAGLVGALLVAVLPLNVHYAQIARPYSLLALLSLASAYFLVRAMDTGRPLLWAGFAVTATLNFYTHFNSLFVLAAEGIFAGIVWLTMLAGVLNKRRPGSDLLGPMAGFGAVVILCLPGIVRLLGLPWTGEGGEIAVQLTSPFFIRFLYRIGLAGPWLRRIFLGLMALGLLITIGRRQWKPALLAVLWLAVPFVTLAVIKSPRSFAERYVIFVPAMGLLLVGVAISTLGQGVAFLARRERTGAMSWAVGLAASMGLALLFVTPLRAYYADNRASSRLDLTLAVVEDRARPGDLILVSLRFLTRPLAANGAEVLYLDHHPSGDELEALISAHQRTWILYTSFLPPAELQEPMDGWVQARLDEFVRVPIKSITALAYHNQALTGREAILQDQIAVLQALAETSADKAEAWLRYEALATAYDALSAQYDERGDANLAAETRQKAEEARATAPRPW